MKIKQILKEYGFYVLLFALLVIICPRYVWGKTIVDGHSMEATLKEGDWLFNEKLSFEFGKPKRFDIVVINSPMEEGEHWIKRVLGLPGETIQILNGAVYIDGELLSEDIYGICPVEYEGIASVPYTIDEGYYFLMGDNREGENSWDSRYEEIGPIKEEDIQEKVFFRTWPLKRIGIVK